LKEQLITYLGNKRKLIPHIAEEIQTIQQTLGKSSLSILEPFSGSGSASRMLKLHANHLVVNDLEGYCATLARCYLASPTQKEYNKIVQTTEALNNLPLVQKGLFQDYYAPQHDERIKSTERVYYTSENGQRIDTIRQAIFTQIPEQQRPFYLAPLLVESSIHTNTSGTFNSFLKKDGVGHFGGRGEHALNRILAPIELPVPVFSYQPRTRVDIHQMDANTLCQKLQEDDAKFDVAYLDPPYNKHPYGTFYFMLNIVNNWDPTFVPPNNLRGQPNTWNRSKYNSFTDCEETFSDLIECIPARYVLLSYNNEGIIPENRVRSILQKYGTVTRKDIVYPTYKACKNLASRSKNVVEYLWILEKK
jgi:adenine-specific DNA-methyltransferase